MQFVQPFEVKWNVEIVGFDRGKRKVLHQRTHNIIVNNGRQFVLGAISALTFGASIERAQNAVIRYIGFGIGGSRQTTPAAGQPPLADTYPAGYGGSNVQSDANLTVSRLERPVKSTPEYWLKQVAAPPAFPTANSVTWSALFQAADINMAPHTMVPISELGLYTSAADPTMPNGGPGTYPGATGHMVAYDTFVSLPKTGYWATLVNWTWTI